MHVREIAAMLGRERRDMLRDLALPSRVGSPASRRGRRNCSASVTTPSGIDIQALMRGAR